MLEGKIALVAGASRGIGRQIALTLDRKDAVVIVNYDGPATKAEEIVKRIKATGGKVEAVQCNVSDFESCGRMTADMVSRYGHLGILMNSAGITKNNLLMKMSEEDFDAVISTNLKSIFSCIKHTSRQMLEQKVGRIINISSVSGVLGNAGQASYCAAKIGIIGITKSVVRELASRGAMVNTMAPGFVATGTTGILSNSVRTAVTEQIPMKHSGGTQDIAETVVFLTSDRAGYATGQVLNVDDGMAVQGALTYVPSCKRTRARLV